MDDGIIRGEKLTTFDIEPDGSRFCMKVADMHGSSRGLSLPAECLTQLIMTLPEMATRLLKMRYRDGTMRIVYPLGNMRAETSHAERITILTMATPDGFEVSFGLTNEALQQLEKVARGARTGARPAFIRN